MKKDVYYKAFGLYVSILSIIVAVFEFVLTNLSKTEKALSLALYTSVYILGFILFYFNTIAREKRVRIALLGDINCGKTFFLAVFFDYLQDYKSEKYLIYPWGKHTLERIQYYLDVLRFHKRFPATRPMEEKVMLEGKAVKAKHLFHKRIHFEMYDSSGEEFNEFAYNQKPRYLYDNLYFDKFVTTSDLVFLMISTDLIWGKELLNGFEQSLNNYISTVQIMADSRAKIKSSTPIALIISKSDLLENYGVTESQTIEKIKKLINVIEKRHLNFKLFFISSIKLNSAWSYDDFIFMPNKIEQPIIWYLEKFSLK